VDGVSIVTEIIGILTAGITGIATGIGNGLKELVDNIFFTTSGETTVMSTFGIMVCVFAGISLAIGLSRLIVQWLSSLGGSRV
jgi:hypothetical protein